jgi:hypothetical protein
MRSRHALAKFEFKAVAFIVLSREVYSSAYHCHAAMTGAYKSGAFNLLVNGGMQTPIHTATRKSKMQTGGDR